MDGTWGTVCDGTMWNHHAASVACHQLGFSRFGLLHIILLPFHLSVGEMFCVPKVPMNFWLYILYFTNPPICIIIKHSCEASAYNIQVFSSLDIITKFCIIWQFINKTILCYCYRCTG